MRDNDPDSSDFYLLNPLAQAHSQAVDAWLQLHKQEHRLTHVPGEQGDRVGLPVDVTVIREVMSTLDRSIQFLQNRQIVHWNRYCQKMDG